MAESKTFAKLNETNWAEWSMFMEATWVRKGLLDVGTGDETMPAGSENSKAVKAWKKKNAEARAEIILAVETSQLAHCRAPDAADVWESLRTIHQTRGFASRLSLRRTFWALTKKPGQSMASWIGEVRSASFRLEESGVTVNDEDIILVLTMGLPSTFDTLIVGLDSAAEADLTLDFVVSRMLNEETRQASSATTPSTLAVDNSAYAAAAHPRTPLERITCFRCGRKGHYQSSCTAAPVDGANVAASVDVVEEGEWLDEA